MPRDNTINWRRPNIDPMELFNRCIKVVLKSEGGYVNNPSDPGGETKYGISKLFFPDEDIKNLTKARAIGLYFKYYWTPMRLEGINSEPLVLQVFDFGVNAGKVRSIRLIQSIVGVEEDGYCGPITKAHINSFKPIVKDSGTYTALDMFKEGRKHYYIDLANRKPEMKIFLKGWLNRIEATHF